MAQNMIDDIPFRVADFEGPLDLLLHLINKNKLNIYNIEILSLVHQYLEYIDSSKKEDTFLASEFVAMAARLVYIKSVMLLPRHDEEKQRLKNELEGELIEYSLCKQVSALLTDIYQGETQPTRQPSIIEKNFTYSHTHDPKELLVAYLCATRDKIITPEQTSHIFEPIVKRRVVSVSSKVIFILKKLYEKKQLGFSSLFSDELERTDNVATFLAVLELIKNKKVIITDDNFIKFGKTDGENIG